MNECLTVAFQVAVPQADMEEILPAARLLSRATAVTPSDYDRAKTLFLAGLHDAGMQAQVGGAFIHPHSDTDLFVICHIHAQTQMILELCYIHVQTRTSL
jgi:hypothetical protein